MYTSRFLMTQVTADWNYDWTVNNHFSLNEFVKTHNNDGIEFFLFSFMSSFFTSNSSVVDETLVTLYIGVPVITLIVFLILQHAQATFYVIFIESVFLSTKLWEIDMF